VINRLTISISQNSEDANDETNVAETLSRFQIKDKLFAKIARYGKTKSKHRGSPLFCLTTGRLELGKTWRYPDHSHD
jgi:hypothetical protein